MKRWCVIATPRSGSTWLEEMICKGVYDNLDSVEKKCFLNLGEYFLPQVYYKSKINFKLDDDLNFFQKNDDEVVVNDELFFKTRLTLIKDNNISQPLVVRLFPDNISWRSFNYFEFMDTLVEKQFNFVGLRRDNFERAISWYLMDNTSLIHKFVDKEHTVYSTKQGSVTAFQEFSSVTIDMNKIRSYITRTHEESPHFDQLVDYVNCPVVNYTSLLEDCKRYNLPVSYSVNIVKNYNIPYEKLITNFQEVKEFYEHFLQHG